MSFCSFFGGEVFQNHFEPGIASGIRAGIAFWVALESLSLGKKDSGEGLARALVSIKHERRRDIPVISVLEEDRP